MAKVLTTPFDTCTYLKNMNRDGTFAEHVIVQALSAMLNLNINLIHVNKHENIRIQPSKVTPSTTITVGHLRNVQHFVSLERIQPQDFGLVIRKKGLKEKTYVSKVLQIGRQRQQGIYTWPDVEDISWQALSGIMRTLEPPSLIPGSGVKFNVTELP